MIYLLSAGAVKTMNEHRHLPAVDVLLQRLPEAIAGYGRQLAAGFAARNGRLRSTVSE